MATIDMTLATQRIDMTDADLVAFSRAESTFSTLWSWIAPDGHDLDLNGSGFSYDAAGRALTGTVTSVAIDLGNNDFSDPDVFITKVDVEARFLDEGGAAFWRSLLAGDDTFLGPLLETAGSQMELTLFGDMDTVPGVLDGTTGGDDLFRLGDATATVSGDIFSDGGSNFVGGNDRIFGAPTEAAQKIVGDAFDVSSNANFVGGRDIIAIRSVNASSFAIGDAETVVGVNGRASVFGGDDSITAENGSAAQLIGDVRKQSANSSVVGGDDTIRGSERGEAIAGDVFEVSSPVNVSVTGGHDTLNGNGGSDNIAGDVFQTIAGVTITGGNDTIRGGDGDDRIFGEFFLGAGASVGGDDQLFGDAGADQLFGQTGNDTLDGGSGTDALDGGAGADRLFGGLDSDTLDGGAGADLLDGGAGGDVASYASAAAGVTADLQFASANTGDAAGDTYVAVEYLVGSAFADFLRGTDQGNGLTGGSGNDILDGRGGNDSLSAGAGVDTLLGGAGNDQLFGGADTDVLNGGAGADRMDGGLGADRLFGDGADTFVFSNNNAAGSDRVFNFQSGLQKLEIKASVFGGQAGVFAFQANGNPAAPNASQALLYDTDDGNLYLDANGAAAGGLVFLLNLVGAPALAAGDILLV